MKQFETLKMNLFDSTNACFRLDVEVKFVTSQQQGSRSLVYVTDHGTGFLKPNVYLTLSYREDNNNNNPVYTSYPQLFGLRQAFGKVKKLLLSGEAYIQSENALTVKAEYAEPIIMSNIGKGNNWISLRLCVMQSGENGVFTYTPGVEVKLSTADNKASALTADEFLTICTIIEDLDLATIQFNASIAYLNAQGSAPVGYMAPGYTANYVQPYYGQPQQGYQQPGYPANNQQGSYYNPQGPRPQPRYGNQNYRGQAPRSNPAPQGQQYTSTPVPQQPVEDGPVTMRPRPVQQTSSVVPQQPGLQPRDQKPVMMMNLKAVEDTPVSDVGYDDTAAIDAIFDEE